MLILQIPPRVVIFTGGVLPTFPAAVTIHVDLGPKEAFGEADLTGKLTVLPPGHTLEMLPDLRNGGIRFKPGGRLALVSSVGPLFDARLVLHGARATIEHDCESDAALRRLIEIVENHVPALLSGPMRAPIEILSVSGTVASQEFRVEFRGTVETAARLADLPGDVSRKLERMQTLPADAAPRIFSAHRYLLQANRLRYASDYPSQFLGERLLNLYKVLEVLFGRDVDQLRTALAALRLRPEIIELLVGLVYVRDEGDVGHPAIHHLGAENYETVQRYILWIEEVVTWLLDHVLDSLAAEDFQLKPVSGSPSKRLQTLAKVALNVDRVNPLRPETFLIGPGGADGRTA